MPPTIVHMSSPIKGHTQGWDPTALSSRFQLNDCLFMASSTTRASSLTCLPLLALVFVAHSAVGFLSPLIHVAPRSISGLPVLATGCPTARGSRCHARSETSFRRRSRNAGLFMEVEPHVLRLQAAELGSRLKVKYGDYFDVQLCNRSNIACPAVAHLYVGHFLLLK